VNSGKPTFPVPFLEAVFKALLISSIELPCGSNSISASFANVYTHKSVFASFLAIIFLLIDLFKENYSRIWAFYPCFRGLHFGEFAT
jgi:hypothetical protein